MADERRLWIVQDCEEEILRCDATVKDRVAPHGRGERNWNGFDARLMVDRQQGGRGENIFSAHSLGNEPCEFGNEPAAVRHRVESEGARHRDPSGRNRYVLGNRDGGGELYLKTQCRYNR